MYALSGGPNQPEFGQPTTVGADNLVDVFSGNFQYSIPLFEIGGYPMTLSYSSDHKMEEEASWVGFGWTLNPGAISRQVRGLPDDFRGDQVTHRANMKPNITTGISPGADFELFGYFGLATALDFSYNNYSGFDFTRDLSPSVNINKILSGAGDTDTNKGTEKKNDKPLTKEEAQERVKAKPKVTFPWQMDAEKSNHIISANINSRAGLENATWSAGNTIRSFSGGINTGGVTYTPTSELPKRTTAFTYNVKVGGKGWWPDAFQATLRGHTVRQELAVKSLSQSAYGYLYSEQAVADDSAIMDYNVEQGGLLNQDATRLPIPYGTPDVFTVTGPAMSGQLEIARRDFQPFRPAKTTSVNVTRGIGGDAAFGNVAHVGANISASNVASEKGGWASFAPPPIEENLIDHRPRAYFRFIGDQSVQTDKEWFDNLQGNTPLSIGITNNVIGLTRGNLGYYASNGDKNLISVGWNNLLGDKSARTPNATAVSYLTAEEARFAAFEKKTYRYSHFSDSKNDYASLSKLEDDRVGGVRSRHHISQIQVLGSGGQRQVYGLPVYNHTKKEVTFNAAGLATTTGSQGEKNYGLVTIDDAMRASVNNNSGTDHYFDEVITPAYPVAHLLTSILSPDYVDVADDGPSLDDLGSYVKIGYSALSDDNGAAALKAIGYRTPIGENTAMLSEGNLSDPEDDKASFSYGTKEVYYVHHMDSKTHRAVFITSDRVDALPVNEQGAVIENPDERGSLQQLDTIKIFTLAELQHAATEATEPTPIKTISFNYAANGSEEQISGNLPNARKMPEETPVNGQTRGGKLTLTSVSFTYANNDRGVRNPYQFEYKTRAINHNEIEEKVLYQPFMMDRWGTQRHRSQNSNLAPIRYPYATQNKKLAAAYADLGNIKRISLPSGGQIDITYEPDDYAYVQNFRAGRMYELAGFSKDFSKDDADRSIEPQLYRHSPLTAGLPNLYAYIKIGKVADFDANDADLGNWSKAEVRRKYLADVDQLYFSSMVTLKEGDQIPEQITGYLGFEDEFLELIRHDDTVFLVLKLKGLKANNKETNNRFSIHPITYAALEKMRAQMPKRLYKINGDKIDLKAMIALLNQSGRLFQNYFFWRLQLKDAAETVPESSYVRLADPTYKKIGGGSRVKTIGLSDNWLLDDGNEANGPQGPSFQYIKEYSYTTTDPVTQETISSGVAANEPLNGKEEMLMVNVGKNNNAKFLAPNQTYYLENPAGLNFFPGASVGYSRVTTKISVDTDIYKQSKPGTTVNEYYTARDYPVKVSMTRLDRKKVYPIPLNLAFVSLYLSRLGLTQGFTIEVNDMHGKPKSSYEYGHDNTKDPISSTTYEYLDKEDAATGTHSLDNLVEVVKTNQNRYGEDSEVYVDRDYLGLYTSVWMEHTSDETRTYGGGAQINADVALPFLAAVVPYPNLTHAQSSLQTAATTKFINRRGILDKVVVTNNGASLSTENHQFDALTGAAVLTSTNNEYDRPIYQHNSLAYWMATQQGMGPAYDYVGQRYEGVSIEQGQLLRDENVITPSLYPGDELYAFAPGGATATGIRLTAVPNGTNTVTLIDDSGSLVTTSAQDDPYTLVLTRSGRRNLLSASSAQVASLSKPDNELFYRAVPENSDVLSSTATVFSDDWGNLCEPVQPVDTTSSPPANPTDPTTPSECDRDFGFNLVRAVEINDICYVEPRDWRPDLQAIEDCGECMNLFRAYAKEGFLPNLSRYATCNTSGAKPEYVLRANMIASINRCDFARGTGDYGLFRGNQVSLETIKESQLDFPCNPLADSTNRVNCVPIDRNLRASSFVLASKRSETLLPATGELQSCFPWHPEADINPYLDGRRGNWRAKSTYTIKQRNRTVSAAQPHTQSSFPEGEDENSNNYSQPLIYKDGVLESYSPFWSSNADVGSETHYQLTNEVTRYDEHGHELETKDALTIESGAQYGFLQNMPIAVAQNASHFDIGFDGFEDYGYKRSASDENKWLRHFGLLDREVSDTEIDGVTSEQSHTGNFAYEFGPGSSGISQTFSLFDCEPSTVYCPDEAGCGDCENGFTPRVGRKYLLSAWVASDNSLAFGRPVGEPEENHQFSTTYLPSLATSGFANSSGTVAETPSGPVVEGWQQIQLVFTLPDGAERLSIRLTPPSTSQQAYYFDDVRIQPFESEMTAYVYDYTTLRLMAQLDDRGYAVFYEYDDEGMLIRQKRETERGIMTITEQHTNLAPAPSPKP